MDNLALNILTSWASSLLVELSKQGFNFTQGKLKSILKKALSKNPSIEQKILQATTVEEKEHLLNEVLGIINLSAEDGSIEISSNEDKALIESLTSIKLDHARGFINISGALIKSNRIFSGGNINSTGTTTITNTQMQTNGTMISIGKGACIKISGNAIIKQN